MTDKKTTTNTDADAAQRSNRILHGTRIAPGLAIGRAYIYKDLLRQDIEQYEIEEEQVGEEHQRILQAIEDVRSELQQASQQVEQEFNAEVADIFRAQETILQDPELAKEILQELEHELLNAEQILRRVFHRRERSFRNMQDTILRQRADDVADLGRRLLFALQGIQAHQLENIPPKSILVAARLLPSDTVFLSKESTVGVVVEFGGPGSHAALLTRALGIPAVGGIEQVLEKITPDMELLIDGKDGQVLCHPDPKTRESFEKKIERYQVQVRNRRQHCHEPAETRDGVRIRVMANVTCREDIEHALEYGADGIGLYRTESFYLAQKKLPSDQQVYDDMLHTLTPARELPITVRLLDIGGDKQVPYLTLPSESDPFLGRRGVRMLLEYPDLLRTQIHAILRLSQRFHLHILAPMITFAEEMQQIRQILTTTAHHAGIEEIPPFGTMIETPAAALSVDELRPFSDFFSIGTNDLTQYTMAAGRENPLVTNYFRDDHPAVLKLVKMVSDQVPHTQLSLCGELAGDPDMTERLLRIGIRTLSVSAPLIPVIKATIRAIHLGEEA